MCVLHLEEYAVLPEGRLLDGPNLLSRLLATGLVLALGSVSAAQTGSAVSEGGPASVVE
jgi:hypothetical protein